MARLALTTTCLGQRGVVSWQHFLTLDGFWGLLAHWILVHSMPSHHNNLLKWTAVISLPWPSEWNPNSSGPQDLAACNFTPHLLFLPDFQLPPYPALHLLASPPVFLVFQAKECGDKAPRVRYLRKCSLSGLCQCLLKLCAQVPCTPLSAPGTVTFSPCELLLVILFSSQDSTTPLNSSLKRFLYFKTHLFWLI